MTGNYIGNNPNGLDIVLSDSYETNNSQLIASTKCVNNVYNNLKELIDSKGLPLGHIYLWPFSTPPDGSIQLNSSTYSRELYSDLWALIQTKGWYKPESEWQQIASANGGYCPWYSDGDGSTTFRTPKFAPYQKIALASGDAGKYTAEGLPNITGESGTYLRGVEGYSNGALANTIKGQPDVSTNTEPANDWTTIRIDASLSNPIYGNSEHVTPESHDWIVCVVAFGKATNVGSVDVANVMSAVGQVQAEVTTAIEIEGYWKSTTQFCIRYKNGIQICGSFYWMDSRNSIDSNVVGNGKTTTFLKPFTAAPAFSAYTNFNAQVLISNITPSFFTVNDWTNSYEIKNGSWVAFGLWK